MNTFRARAASLMAFVAWWTPALALAHHGEDESALAWTWDPWILVPLALSAALYGLGDARLEKHSTVRPLRRRHARCFWLGWLVLGAALVSPLHALGEHAFAAHMFEHELLMLAAAPLLVYGEPLGRFVWALPPPARVLVGRLTRTRGVSGAWRYLTHPATATALQATMLWAWHTPALFDVALDSEGWHAVQHLSFLVSALLFWTAMLDRQRMRHRPAVSILCLFFTALVSGALGALMAFSHSPWYAAYAQMGMTPLGLTPPQDQQVAGLLMWIPGGVVHAAVALGILFESLRRGTVGEQA